ncbi:MAG: PIG-L family deacetylase [Deltaproteobacteria bacterium]|nr:PIG-L family deacetylase [Deltaproteobacteria bacterium]MBU49198.1 PIG-L family deacetylase [Deltaproteobacteria bacterium]|tara:strand:- start:3854 stop:6421 length:2568 start_codon:yes stop_codon:yes gene_type:complete
MSIIKNNLFYLTLLYIAFGHPVVSHAGHPTQPNAARLLHSIQRLSVVGRVLYVAAHPDDENTALLAYLAGQRKVEAGYLSLTRGDGGQNMIGSEQASLLGIIRTQELLQARRIDGATQFFTRAKDFGYSPTSKESLAFWGRKRILADVVWVMRRFRPDVVITRFPEKGRTHGHHLASAQLARAAFLAAGDPKRFPEQLKHVKVWRPRRLLYNVSTWRLRRRGLLKNKKYLSQFLSLDIGGYHPLLGLSYGEISAKSRSMHKSQGFGRSSRRGKWMEYFRPLLGDRPKQDLLEGIALSWKRFKGGEVVSEALKAAEEAYQPNQPERIVPHLLKAYEAMKTLPQTPRLQAKRKAIKKVIVGCLGLYLDARAKTSAAVPGHTLSVSLRALSRRPAALSLQSITLSGESLQTPLKKSFNIPLKHHKRWRHGLTLSIPKSAKVSAPSWLRKAGTFGTYHIPANARFERPEDPSPLRVQFALKLGKSTLNITRGLRYVWTERVRGELSRRVEVTPPITTTPTLPMSMFPNNKTQRLSLDVQSFAKQTKGRVFLRLPKGWRCSPPSFDVSFQKVGEVKRVTFMVTPLQGTTEAAFATPVVLVKGRTYNWKVKTLHYTHLPTQTIFQPAKIKIVPVKLKSLATKIGYIKGSGDLLVDSLKQVGVRIEVIDNKAVAQGAFGPYDTIVLGIRALNVNRTLRTHYKRLLAWVKRGGTLLVQYNTNSWWRPLKLQVGPYPMTIGRARVTDETAVVTPLLRRHPMMLRPHLIRKDDFDDWVQERGLYFSTKWDKRYKTLFSMADPGKSPARGSTLVTTYGKGTFIYTGLSFFRQLPAGVPGAYRLLLNFLAYKSTDQAAKSSSRPAKR